MAKNFFIFPPSSEPLSQTNYKSNGITNLTEGILRQSIIQVVAWLSRASFNDVQGENGQKKAYK